MSRATTDFQLCREDDGRGLLEAREEYEAWLDSLPNNTSVDGNVAAWPDNCEEMFNTEQVENGSSYGQGLLSITGRREKEIAELLACNVQNLDYWEAQARIYSSLSADDLKFLVAHIRQDEAYKCAELCEDIRERVSMSVDEHSAKAAALCSMAIRTKRMGTIIQEDGE